MSCVPPVPWLSVVVPILNEAKRLPELLLQLETRLPDAEWIFVDGYSLDGSISLLGRYEGSGRLSAIQAGPGRGVQLHAGACEAKAPWLFFMHADARLPRDAAAHLRQAIEDPNCEAAAFRTWHYPEAGASRLMTSALHLADLRSRYTPHPYGDQGLLVRRSVYQSVGGFSPIPLMEDLDLSRRLAARRPLRILRASLGVSGRRFQEGPLRYTLMVNVFPLLWRLGVSPARLAALYHHVR